MKLAGLSARANQLSLMACRSQPIRDRVPSAFLTLTANLSPGRGLTSPLLATVGCLGITRKGQSLLSTLSLHDRTLRSPRGRVVLDYPLSQTTTILGCSAAPTNKRIIPAGLVDCSPPFLEGWGGLQDYDLITQPLPSPGGGKLALIPHGQGEGLEL